MDGGHQRRVGKFEQVAHSSDPNTVSWNEMDSHADTCVAGPNWRLLEYSGLYCDLQPFPDDYSATKNIPIGRCVSKFVHPETGKSVILDMPQALYFGNKLRHSLLNPNQIRHFGVSLCDDPFDLHRPLGMSMPSDDFRNP